MKISLALVLALAFSSAAHAACEVDPWGSVDRARQEEQSCLRFDDFSKVNECLEVVADWWFECGGNYVTYNPYTEMTRIFEIQLLQEPTRIETISHLAYYTFSIEVDAIAAKSLPDFTRAPMEAFLKRESLSSENYMFYNLAMDPAILIVGHAMASLPTKKAYYAFLKRASARADALWAAADKSGIPAETQRAVALQLGVGHKVLIRYQALDQ